MSAAPEQATAPAPTYVTGWGQYDTHAVTLGNGQPNPRPESGKPYETITGEEIAAMMLDPPGVQKEKAQWFIPSTFAEHDGRDFDTQREHGVFHWLALDVDKGNPSLADVQGALRAALGPCSWVIYATRSATQENRKWRALVRLSEPLAGADYTDTQTAFFDLLQQAPGGGITPDTALRRTGQLVYLPNRGAFYEYDISREPRLSLTGHPVTQRRDSDRQARVSALNEAKTRRAAKAAQRIATQSDEIQPVDHFNDANTVADMLAHYGYEQCGQSKDWRSPMQTTRSYATRDIGDHWVSMSGSDAAHEIGFETKTGHRAGDAFDLFVHFDHAGNFNKAVIAYSGEAGLNHQAQKPWALEGFNQTGEATGQKNAEHNEAPQPQWPEPDSSILNPERPPAPEMSDTELGTVFGPWAEWLKDAAEVKSAHVDYVALGLLTSASALIGNSRWAVPWEGWKEPPVLWGMLVGDPSSGKSPAQDAILDPLKALDDEYAQAYLEERKTWEAADELASLANSQWKNDAREALANDDLPPGKPESATAGPAPVRPRIRINDVTIEKVAVLLASTWRGLLLARDELSGWLSSMDRYASGGDRPFWLESFGGRSYIVDRKSNPEPITVDHLSVSIFGGTQPDKLNDMLLGCSDDGMLARFLVVFPDPVELKRPTATLNESKMTNAFKRLRGLAPSQTDEGGLRPFYVNFSEDAKAALHEFRIECRQHEGEATGLMKSHIGKMPGFVVRVAHVLAQLDWCADPDSEMVTQIEAQHIGRAAFYVGDHLRGHANRAYGSAPSTFKDKLARRLAALIRAEDMTTINIREIQRRELSGNPKSEEIRAAIKVLMEADWLAPLKSAGAGRPKGEFAVNPRLGDMK